MVFGGKVWLAILLTILVGCGDDQTERDGLPDYDDPASADMPSLISGTQHKADNPTGSPKILSVEWSPIGSCDSRRVSAMQVHVTIDDPDTNLDELRIEGSVTGCSVRGRDYGPVIQGSTSEMLCHHVSNHTGLIAVTDPAGNGDTIAFRFGPCDTGAVSR